MGPSLLAAKLNISFKIRKQERGPWYTVTVYYMYYFCKIQIFILSSSIIL